jgi:hypothetical protein
MLLNRRHIKAGEKNAMRDQSRQRIVGILGLGLDGEDRHVRITKGKNFAVYLGSEATHERLSATCVRINEQLDRKGRRLEDLSRAELVDLISDVESS